MNVEDTELMLQIKTVIYRGSTEVFQLVGTVSAPAVWLAATPNAEIANFHGQNIRGLLIQPNPTAEQLLAANVIIVGPTSADGDADEPKLQPASFFDRGWNDALEQFEKLLKLKLKG